MGNRPWALASWAPFTFIGIEINKLPTTSSISRRGSNAVHNSDPASIELLEGSNISTSTPLAAVSHRPTSPARHDGAPPATGQLAGVYLGILNLYTTLPQFIATGISTVVFTVLEQGKSPELAQDAHPDEHHSTDGFNGIAVCLFIGAVASVGAAFATQRLKYVY